MINIYRSDAQMNGLITIHHTEEKAVELFALNIMKAGEQFFDNPMDTPFIPTWSRIKSAIPDFIDRLHQTVERDNADLKMNLELLTKKFQTKLNFIYKNKNSKIEIKKYSKKICN